MIVGRAPGVDQVFFSCSGTDADMFVVRIARAFSGRQRIFRFRGGYHGTYDPLIGFDPEPLRGFPGSAKGDVALRHI